MDGSSNMRFTWGIKPFTYNTAETNSVAANSQFNLPGITHGLIIVISGPVAFGVHSAAVSMDISVINTYKAKRALTNLGGMESITQSL